MKGATSKWLLATILSLCAGGAQAGNCELAVTRTACAGKEAISFKKCEGKPSCTEFVEAADAAACKKAATDACENKRLNVTKSKVIGAKFDGAALKTDKGDTDFCKAYPNRAEEFDKC
ncbi:hypothetical protein [Chitinimonas sp. BJB300]|uniref:hypothetical protein n=1 Tax=Chitinimonas sp. BJB300 TaxID=1559339 RepID=UPI000C11F8CA|nr:hypothetical protein [Chitinimonas sp. BJB300]PHV11256.1 hypothetical protein CSQ89_11755 [Chitinimonas sp. BJB300]TSJ90788.1 hypothetical protein FG002_000245 [Chitinimonas sp. BJB300]